MFYLTMHSTHFNTGIWHRTYGKGPFRERERKHAAITWATLFIYTIPKTVHTTAFVTPVVEH